MSSEISFDKPNYRIYFGPSFNNEEYEFVKNNSLYKYMAEPGHVSGYTETTGLTNSYKSYLKDIFSKRNELVNLYNACISLFAIFYTTLAETIKEKIKKENISTKRNMNFLEEYVKTKIKDVLDKEIYIKFISFEQKYKISKKEVLSNLYQLNKRNMYITCAYIYYVRRNTFRKDEITFIKKINLNKLYVLSREFFSNNKIQKILKNYYNILKLSQKINPKSGLRHQLVSMKMEIEEKIKIGQYFVSYNIIISNLEIINEKIITVLNNNPNIENIKEFLKKFILLLKNISHTYDASIVIEWIKTNMINFDINLDTKKAIYPNKMIKNNLNNQLLTQTMSNIKNTGKFIYVSLSKETNMNNNFFNKLTNQTGTISDTQNLFFKYCVFSVMGELIQHFLRNINSKNNNSKNIKILSDAKALYYLANQKKLNSDSELMKDINNYYLEQCNGTSYFK